MLVAAAGEIKDGRVNPGRSPVLSRTRAMEDQSEGRTTEMGGGGWKCRKVGLEVVGEFKGW